MKEICRLAGCEEEAIESSTYGYCADHKFNEGGKGGDGSKRSDWKPHRRGAEVGYTRRGNNTFGSRGY